MDQHHYVSGFFAAREEAQATRAELVERGLPRDPLHSGLSKLVAYAIASGQFVLVAETRTGQQTATARKVIKASVGGYKDAAAA